VVPEGIINLARSLLGNTTSYTLSMLETPFWNKVTLPSPLASLVADTLPGRTTKSPVPLAPAVSRVNVSVWLAKFA
jgi:hypothetical protein